MKHWMDWSSQCQQSVAEETNTFHPDPPACQILYPDPAFVIVFVFLEQLNT
jgi:hypothetical protein